MSSVESRSLLACEEAVAQLGRLIQSAFDVMEHPESCQPSHSVRLSVPIEELDQLVWVGKQSHREKIFWRDREGRRSVAGVGAAAVKHLKAGESIRGFLRCVEMELNPVYPDLRWYGGIRFDRSRVAGERDNRWDAFGDGLFFLPRFELVVDGDDAQLVCNLLTDGTDRDRRFEILDQLQELSFDVDIEPDGSLRVISRSVSPSREVWGRMMAGAMDAIETGQIEKIVMARRTELEFTDAVDHWSLMRRWGETITDSYLWAIQLTPDNCFIGSSPERLYALRNGVVESEAVAGTRPRGATEREDKALKAELAESSKDQREFEYVSATVDSALSCVCDHVTHDRQASILSLATLQHLRLQYSGQLREGMRNGDVLEALHPTPAVGGTPRLKAIELIRTLELFDRGWYSGPIGWVGSQSSEFAVGIRSGLVHRDRMFLFAGAGVVAGSTIEGEWREIEQKSAGLLSTLGLS